MTNGSRTLNFEFKINIRLYFYKQKIQIVKYYIG